MKLSEVSIRRPVFATVMSVVIVLFGAISYSRLPVREFPDIDPPIVSIVTFYRGASPSVIETQITDVLEEQLATLEGVKRISSSSQEQGSVITVEFELKRDVDEAANDVRDRVARVRGELPQETDEPIVAKVDTNAQAVLWLALSSDRHDGLELSEVADVLLKDRLQRLTGVGSVMIGGERRYAMRVWIDPRRLSAYALTPTDVERALRLQNAEIPGGRIEGEDREFAVRTRGDLSTPEQFAAIVVGQVGPRLVRLGDVAEVEIGAEDERTVARYNGREAVGLGIVKQSKASTVETSAAVHRSLPDLRALLPEGMRLDVAYDSATFIQESIREVAQTLLLAAALVVLVIFVFLKSLRATAIPVLAIPISIVGAFTVAYFLGFTVNILTLLALVLAIGLVVDDAIIVLENVYRHMEMGKTRLRAALDGSREIGFAVVATTIALVAVFGPVAFLTGNVGRLFREFAVSVAVAVLLSGFVALTLTPMLCSRILKPLHGAGRSWGSRSFDAFFRGLDRAYGAVLGSVLRHPLLALVAAALVVVPAVGLARLLPRELIPAEDRGWCFGLVIAPEGATLEYTDRYMRAAEAKLLTLPEREGLFTAVGLGFEGPGRVTNGIIFVNLKDRKDRDRSVHEIVEQLFPEMFSISGVLAFVVNPPSLGGEFSAFPVSYVLEAETYEELQAAVPKMLEEAGKPGIFFNLDTDLKLNKPQLDITIDRDRAAQLGVAVTDIGATLETLLGGRVVTKYRRGGKQYDVIVQLRPKERATPDVIHALHVPGTNGPVRLANVVRIAETVGPKELNHFNRLRSATITANLLPGASLGRALDALDDLKTRFLPAGIKRELTGQSREFRDSSTTLYWLFLGAVVFIYLVLAAQFESFIHPLSILVSVPLAIVGAVIALFLFGQSLNVYSQIGLIMLIGLVTKNAILIVEFSNQLRERGLEVREAVSEASRLRLRPILMTSFATVFGVLPLALGLGAGGESRQPLGIAVVGGLLSSTFLTLVIVPVVYLFFAKVAKARSVDAEGEALAVPAGEELAGQVR